MIKISPLAFLLVFALQPLSAATLDFETKENIALSGKIATVKTSKKYSDPQKCAAFCASRESCVAFTLDTKRGSCTLLKNVSSEKDSSKSYSGFKA